VRRGRWPPSVQPSRPRVLSSPTGAVLAEVLVGVVIAATVLGLAVGGGSLLVHHRLSVAVRRMAADLRAAEQRARAERTCYRVVFSPVEDVYRIFRYGGAVQESGGSPLCADATAWPTEPALREYTDESATGRMPAGVDLAGTTFAGHTLHISPLGNTNAGTVVLRSLAGQEQRVVVELTGRVRVAP
jgi:hypothetical protein